ncbi:MAG: methyltransferase domain-containing protein [Alphaproteobacteria bacterium]|nr:methyltransferase domain-containing protein [Alphaproteobacteria bacterium]
MGFYSRHILPHLINCACGARPIEKQRAKIVPLARGVVLELGFGSGRNLAYLDAARVERLYALEPEEGMLALSRKAALSSPAPIEVLACTAEEMTLPDASVDTILVTYTLCTIPDAVRALSAARRTLKPDGVLLFTEHGRAPDAEVQRAQAQIEPLWKRIAGGCHLTRDMPAIIADAGFRMERLETMYLPKTPRFAGFNYFGSARPA